MEADLAYLAGIIDGEGSIYMRIVNNTVSPRLQVVNTDERLIDWLQSRYGGKRYVVTRMQRETHKPLHHWHLGAIASVPLLKMVLPYLVLKREQAELAITAWEGRQPTPTTHRRYGTARLDPAILDQRKEWVAEMRTLNKKGKS